MPFTRLIESQRAAIATSSMLEGAGVSALVHAVLIGGWMYAHRDISRVVPDPDASFSPVQWLVPKDQIPGRPQRETVTFTTLTDARAGEGFQEPTSPTTRDESRVEIELPKGKAAEIDVAPQEEISTAPIALGDSIMTEFMVDSAVLRTEDGVAPQYPETMLRRRIEGIVIVQYVVDTSGRADTATFRVISATHLDFARAVKATLPQMRFRPAIMASKLVPQLVQQPFSFKIQDTTMLPGKPPQDVQAPRNTECTDGNASSTVAERHQFPVAGPPFLLPPGKVLQRLHQLSADVRILAQRV
jgi:TonB family protein